MVADPVQATVQTLKDFYRQANHFLEDQQDKITKSPYYDKVVNLTKGIEGPGGSIATPPKDHHHQDFVIILFIYGII